MGTVASNRIWIPPISDVHLKRRAEHIRPIVRFAEGPKGHFRNLSGFPCYISIPGIHSRPYLHKPKYYKRDPKLEILTEITTFHPFDLPLCFQPSVADVLAAIPEELVSKVIAFEIVELLEDAAATEAGFHAAKTCLYTKG